MLETHDMDVTTGPGALPQNKPVKQLKTARAASPPAATNAAPPAYGMITKLLAAGVVLFLLTGLISITIAPIHNADLYVAIGFTCWAILIPLLNRRDKLEQ
jgi:hypothetical protein